MRMPLCNPFPVLERDDGDPALRAGERRRPGQYLLQVAHGPHGLGGEGLPGLIQQGPGEERTGSSSRLIDVL